MLWDKNIVNKKGEKMTKYSPLAKGIRKMRPVLTTIVWLVFACCDGAASQLKC